MESLYFLAILPPKTIAEKIYGYKQLAKDKFSAKAALRSPAHITLHMPFKWKVKKEAILIERLSGFTFSDLPIHIQLNNFAFFPPRVAYIHVEDNEKLGMLQNELAKYIRKQLNIYNADYKDRPFHPHITVAFRDIKKSIYPELETFFSKENYSAEFYASKICLMKHNGKVWNEIMCF